GLADAYVLTARLADAQRLFERLVALCNDVGFLAEEYDTGAQRAVGNFPQVFSHTTLVNTTYNITVTRRPCEQRSGNPCVTAATSAEDEEVVEVLLGQTGPSAQAARR